MATDNAAVEVGEATRALFEMSTVLTRITEELVRLNQRLEAIDSSVLGLGRISKPVESSDDSGVEH